MKTLIILTGNARGGENTWETMYENLMKPYNADLAICFGDNENTDISLFKKSKYVWKIREYGDWFDYFRENCNGFWESNLWYGIDGTAWNSGLPGFVIKDYILKNYKNIIEQYDRIILTRSDYYYLHKHPILSNDHLWIVEGEDYGSYCDRFYVFPSKFVDKVMGIVDYLDSKELHNFFRKVFKNGDSYNVTEFSLGYLNTEYYYKLFFEHTGIVHKIRRSPRVHFLVSLENDHTRTFEPRMPFKDELYIKYYTEFNKTCERVHFLKVPDYIE
jgi:hypothetical protein